MLRLAKLATPLTAVTVVVPDRVPPLGFVPRATATDPANPVATLPPASSAVTCTGGVIAAPAAVALGCTLKTNRVPLRVARGHLHRGADRAGCYRVARLHGEDQLACRPHRDLEGRARRAARASRRRGRREGVAGARPVETQVP